MADLVGQTIGPYQIIERLGRGGMADVYKAFHAGLAVHRALKVIRPEFVTEEGFRERFQREAQAVAGLRHPNIVQMHDFGVQGNLYYMVMEFIEGQDLRSSLAQHGQIRPFDQVLPIIQQVAAALTYAHKRGVVHRDIKPGNIMLTKEDQVILTDFGIAKMLAGEERMTQTGVGIGTPAYMAPEQARGLPDVGPTADVYSLGVVLYEMLTGRVPFSADTPLAVMLKVINDPLPPPRDFSPDIPDVLQGVILKATAKKPDQRYPTAEALVDGLKRSLTGHPAEAVDETIRQPSKRTKAAQAAPPPNKKRSSAPWLMAGAVLLLCFLATGGAGLGYYFWSRPAPALAAWQFVVDASAGMNETVEGQPKMEIAREALAENLSILPANVEAGVRVFGGDGPGQGSCQSTDLLVEPSTGQREQLAQALSGVTPGGEAPLTQAIVAAIGDFDPSQEINKTLIIITAGLDTCEADAVAQLETLSRRLGIEFDLQLIGLGVAEEAVQVELRAIAEAAGGDYHNAQSTGDILAVIEREVAKLPEAPVVATAQTETGSTNSSEEAIILQVADQVSTPEGTQTYQFEAEAGQTVYFDFQSADSGIYFILTAPDGRTELFNVYNGDTDPVTLQQPGAYTLTVDPDQADTPSYEFILWDVAPAILEGQPLEFGQTITGKTTIPGQIAQYNFQAEAGQAVYFDFLSADTGAYFILTAPDGRTELFNVYNGDTDPVELEQAGNYILTVDPDQEGTPAYEFIVWELDPPVIAGGQAEFGQVISGKVDTPGQVVTYQVEAAAGQTVYFEFLSADSGTYFILTAPDEYTEVFNIYSGSSDPITLEQTGGYVLTVDPDQVGTPAFEFILWDVTPPVIEGGSIEFNRLVSGEVDIPGQVVTYQLDGSAGQSVVFNFQEAESGIYFILTAPDGTEIFNIYNSSTEPVELPQTGTYTLTVDPDGGGAPKFGFALELQ